MLSPGGLAFYDSTRPYTLHLDDPFHQLVVQIPKRDLMLRDTRQLTARALGQGTAGGGGGAVFFSLFRRGEGRPGEGGGLAPPPVRGHSACPPVGVAGRPRPRVA